MKASPARSVGNDVSPSCDDAMYSPPASGVAPAGRSSTTIVTDDSMSRCVVTRSRSLALYRRTIETHGTQFGQPNFVRTNGSTHRSTRSPIAAHTGSTAGRPRCNR